MAGSVCRKPELTGCMFDMRRRDFITLLGATTVTWPFVARAQQPATPVIGLLGGGAPESFASALAGFSQGLQEIGIVEGRTAAIEARWARGEYGRLPARPFVAPLSMLAAFSRAKNLRTCRSCIRPASN